MFDNDHAAIAAAQDFSTGIAMWRAEQAAKPLPAFTPRSYFSKRSVAPIAVATLLTLVNFLLLGCALLPANAIL